MRKFLIDFIPGILGAILGGIVGYYGTYLVRTQGFYAPVLPGAFAGLACGMLSRTHSIIRGLCCAVVAGFAGLLTEWLLFFLPREKSLNNFLGFVKQMPDEPMVTQGLLALGIFLGFWWGREPSLRGRGREPLVARKLSDQE